MAAKVPAKSILKQQTPKTKPTVSDEQKAQAERDRRHLGIALYHANKIQQQKDIEARILANIETLLEYPSTSPYPPGEASRFVSLVAPFQPSDFDSLVEERRIDGKCGYALCSNTPRSVTLGASAVWKLKAEDAGDYCSNDCVRKALYVKMQLSEVPAWERAPEQQPKIVLCESGRSVAEFKGLGNEYARHQQTTSVDELALERGETAASFRPNQVMADTVVEKSVSSYKPPKSTPQLEAAYSSIEGYVPTQTLRPTPQPAQPTVEDNFDEDEAEIAANDIAEDDEDESWRALYENISRR